MRALIFIILASAAGAETGAGPVWPDCYCTDKNRDRFELGDQICITVDGRSFMAQCQMSQNNPMWREIGEICNMSQQAVQPTLYARLVNAQITTSINQVTVQN